MKIALGVLLAASTCLAGCGHLGRSARVDPIEVAVRPPADKCGNVSGIGGGSNYAINLDCFRFQAGDGAPQSYDRASSADAAGTGPRVDETVHTAYSLAKASAAYRDRLEAVLLARADAICEKEKGHIFANEAGVGLAFDVLASSFAGAASIVTGEQANSILSGLAGLSTATRSHVTANVYKNQIVPAITNVMDAERKSLLDSIVALRQSGIAQYSADDMIRRVNLYNQACSFQRGVQLLLKASENKAGTDAILRSINLRQSMADLKIALATVTNAEQRAALEADYANAARQLAAIAESTKGDATVTPPRTDAGADPAGGGSAQ